MSKREAKLYFDDIKDSILKIEKYIENLSYDEFVNNGMILDAVVRNLSIIGLPRHFFTLSSLAPY